MTKNWTTTPAKLTMVRYNKGSRTIVTFSDDDKIRLCKISRMSLEDARSLYSFLKEATREGWPVYFGADDGWSPDIWFCDVQVRLDDMGELCGVFGG